MLRPRCNGPWCSGPTCQPVTLEIAGLESGRVRHHQHPSTPRPPARTGRSLALCHNPAVKRLAGSRRRPPRSQSPFPSAAGCSGSSADVPLRRPPATWPHRRLSPRPASRPRRAAESPAPSEPPRRRSRRRSSPTSRSCRSPTSARRGSDGPRGSRVGAAGGARAKALELVEADADAILAALELEPPAASRHLILAKDAKTLQRHREEPQAPRTSGGEQVGRAARLGETDVVRRRPHHRPREWRLDRPPRGRGRRRPRRLRPVRDLDDVRRRRRPPDRGVHQTISIRGKGEDFPFDGVRRDHRPHLLLRVRPSRAHHAPHRRQAMRDLMKAPTWRSRTSRTRPPNTFRWHTSGVVFSADRRNLEGSSGPASITCRSPTTTSATPAATACSRRSATSTVSDWPLGAGKDLKAARKPAIIETNGVKVAILGYDLPATTTPGRAARSAPPTRKNVGRMSRRPARPAPTSWSSSRTGASSTARGPSPAAAAGPPDHRRRGRHGHRQPCPLGRGDGGLQGQADLVRARQLRVRPDRQSRRWRASPSS